MKLRDWSNTEGYIGEREWLWVQGSGVIATSSSSGCVSERWPLGPAPLNVVAEYYLRNTLRSWRNGFFVAMMKSMVCPGGVEVVWAVPLAVVLLRTGLGGLG